MENFSIERINETVRGYASIQQTKTGKLVLRVSMHPDDMEALLLQSGKQTEGLIDSIILLRKADMPKERRFTWW